MNLTHIYKMHNDNYNNTIFIMREDLLPISFGGNKVRKAVLFFEDIKQGRWDCVVTYGSSSSNHSRAISNVAASEGIPCYIITPSESSKPTSNSKIVNICGAKLIQCPISEVTSMIEKTIEELKSQGFKPYFIKGGGHGNVGTQAYVDAYKEIVDYEKANGVHFDYIFHASGTGTTQAGLVCGRLIHGDQREIIGISIARKNPYGGQVVLESVNSYINSLGKVSITDEAITFIDDYVLDGYGTYNNEILQTVRKVLIYDGIPLDTTYTGKAFWGMQDYIQKNKVEGKNVLFIHTGGTPLFFDDMEALTNE